MKTLACYKSLDKTFRIDVTDIFSFKNNLKFELIINAKDQNFVIKDYLLEKVCEDDECLLYLIFDFENICFEKVKSIDLIQFKNQDFLGKRIIYYCCKII